MLLGGYFDVVVETMLEGCSGIIRDVIRGLETGGPSLEVVWRPRGVDTSY
jgi:hypothetical protein